MNILEGKVVAEGMKVGIVVARFNEFITSKLLSGAIDGLVRHDVNEDDVDVAWVPGAFEIPLVASKMAKSRKYDAVICLLENANVVGTPGAGFGKNGDGFFRLTAFGDQKRTLEAAERLKKLLAK